MTSRALKADTNSVSLVSSHLGARTPPKMIAGQDERTAATYGVSRDQGKKTYEYTLEAHDLRQDFTRSRALFSVPQGWTERYDTEIWTFETSDCGTPVRVSTDSGELLSLLRGDVNHSGDWLFRIVWEPPLHACTLRRKRRTNAGGDATARAHRQNANFYHLPRRRRSYRLGSLRPGHDSHHWSRRIAQGDPCSAA